ncbi:uncharacterized protein BT62DRAFT_924341 [Guyanagaster necrorhizus]|uniref:Uncharacterized protein n=1 Tax=Guyanagaster necrorhizus TaxID=856835 RepID=A0A9P7VG52_9AGAR|nr:uncharacterized protein BT62DRAFT_924341 [Guyanagaster necrorhizus MCA 3950]KAG7439958.1 hypothetical protein BT62DRAFT_924341 [Guyanagaster necrorhizus MCA 3950]
MLEQSIYRDLRYGSYKIHVQDQHYLSLKSIIHLCESTSGLERVGVTKEYLLGITEIISDRVVYGDIREAYYPMDFDKVISGGVVECEKLSDNAELGGGVDSHAEAIEGLIAHISQVEVTVPEQTCDMKAVDTYSIKAHIKISEYASPVKHICLSEYLEPFKK